MAGDIKVSGCKIRVRSPNSGNANNPRNVNNDGNINNNNANNSNGAVPDCEYMPAYSKPEKAEISALTYKELLTCPVRAKIRASMRLFYGIVSLYTMTNIYGVQMDIKDEVCSFENLYKAMQHCKRGVMWKDSVAGFAKNGLANVHKLKKNLEDGTYKLDSYTHFKVYEPKERDIVSTRIKDRVFQRSFCTNYFYGQMTKSFIYDNVACQVDKGNEFGRKRLITHMQRFYRKHGTDGWVLKIDIKNFFGSTPHSLAMKAVSDLVPDPWAVSVVKQVVDSYNHGEDPEVGMGLGSEMTQLIQLAVLNKLDHYIKERLRIKYYIRYNDDMILIHHDKEYLRKCKEEISRWLIDHSLMMHPKKTQLFRVTQTIRFLGFRYRLTDTGKVVLTLIPDKVSHERRKLTKLVGRAKAGIMTREDVDICYQSWKAYSGNHHKPGTVRKKAHRHTHNLILAMDQHYKNLWKE